MENFIKIVTVLIWPLTVLIILLIFKRPIIGLTELIGSVEIPGGAKILLDRKKVEKIIEEGTKQNIPANQLADQIVKSAEDANELRILRALFNEEDGRQIINYEKYYTQAMKSLLNKGFIEKRDKRFYLTPLGLEAIQRHLVQVLTRQGALADRA